MHGLNEPASKQSNSMQLQGQSSPSLTFVQYDICDSSTYNVQHRPKQQELSTLRVTRKPIKSHKPQFEKSAISNSPSSSKPLTRQSHPIHPTHSHYYHQYRSSPKNLKAIAKEAAQRMRADSMNSSRSEFKMPCTPNQHPNSVRRRSMDPSVFFQVQVEEPSPQHERRFSCTQRHILKSCELSLPAPHSPSFQVRSDTLSTTQREEH